MSEPGEGGAEGPRPERIGRYQVVREMGRGSMGIVYEAKDPSLERTVALKTIDLAVAAGFGRREEFEKRFFAEARIAARLSHPGIVTCHDVGKDPDTGTLYIVLEHLEGQTLDQRMKARGALGWQEAVAIVAKAARAMDHAHRHGVIHRDLKPSNVMLLDSGESKILDFGIAKVETTRAKLTAVGHFLGSPLYMSPEQALGNVIDSRTDIFSLGSILCALLLGRAYFAAANIPAILARIIREEPPALSEAIAGIPPSLDYVIARAMAKNPPDRYASGDVMADDLEDVLASRPPQHEREWSPVRAEGTMRGRPGDDALLAELTGPHTPAGPAADAADPLAGLRSLVEEAVPRAPAGRNRDPGGAPARADARLAPRPQGKRVAGAPPALWAAVLVMAAVLLAMLLARGRPAPESALAPTPATPTPQPTRAAEATPGPLPAAASQTETQASPESTVETTTPGSLARASPPATRPLPSADKSHLQLTIEHPLKSGHLRLWIDEQLAYETELRATVAKKIVTIKIREARIQKTLEIEPGKHEIRVVVTWDDNERAETTFASFRPEGRRELEIKLGRIRKNLSLEWK